jgi:hypothetical protein
MSRKLIVQRLLHLEDMSEEKARYHREWFAESWHDTNWNVTELEHARKRHPEETYRVVEVIG